MRWGVGWLRVASTWGRRDAGHEAGTSNSTSNAAACVTSSSRPRVVSRTRPGGAARPRATCPARHTTDGVAPQDLLDLTARERAGEVVPLPQLAPQLAQNVHLRLALDSLCDRRHAQALAEPDDRADDLRVLLGIAEHVHERTVDLEDVDREPVEVAERRETGAEV